MKNLIKAYTTFSPRLYNILVVLVGTPLLALLGLYVGFLSESLSITMIILLCVLLMVDIYGDFFVFQGVFSKQYEFGILRNSVKGEKIIKLALLGDMIKRLLMYFVVLFGASFPYREYMIESGLAANSFEHIVFILDLALIGYFSINVSFMITRMVYNFYDGLLAMILSSIVSGCINACLVMGLFSAGSNAYVWFIVAAILAIGISFIMIERVLNKFRLSFGDKEMGRFGDDSKKKMWIFLAVAFGIDFLMMPLMYYGMKQGADLTLFVLAQMFYPACGVMLAKMFSYNEGKLPMAAYITTLIVTVAAIIASVLSVTAPKMMESPVGEVGVYYMVINYVIMLASILYIVFLCACGKEKRENAGFRFKNPGKSIGFIFLFLVLFFGRLLIAYVIDGIQTGDMATSMGYFTSMFTSPDSLAIWVTIFINLPFTFVMFLGEEYGWRYYLQPIMQKKFGVALGTILLGIAWGVWHLGADLMFYTTETGAQQLVAQIITCISFAIFFGYAYMKTRNIWVPVAMHFFNNNLIMLVKGDVSTAAMQGNVIEWSAIPMTIILGVVFWGFIFTPTMRGKGAAIEEEKEAMKIPYGSEEA